MSKLHYVLLLGSYQVVLGMPNWLPNLASFSSLYRLILHSSSHIVSASLDLVALLNNYLLNSKHDTLPASKYLIPPSIQSRYMQAWSLRDHRYFWTTNCLQILRFTQLLLEMLLRRNVSEQTRWSSIIALESVKCLLRLTLLSITKRPIINSPLSQVTEEMPLPVDARERDSSSSAAPVQSPTHLKNNRIPLGDPTHQTSLEGIWASHRVRPPTIVDYTKQILPLRTPQSLLSELLYIFRPLIYVICIVKHKGRNRTDPLTWAIMMELFSRWLRRRVSANATLEREEYARRDRDLLWYLLRGRFWVDFTRPKVEEIITKLTRLPVIGILGFVVQEWIPLINTYYYYTST